MTSRAASDVLIISAKIRFIAPSRNWRVLLIGSQLYYYTKGAMILINRLRHIGIVRLHLQSVSIMLLLQSQNDD